MKQNRVLFTSIDGFIGSNIFRKFNTSDIFFLTDKESRVDIKKNVYYYQDFEKIVMQKKINVVFNNRGTLLGTASKLNRINHLDSKKIFNISKKYNVNYFINLDTNKVLSYSSLPSSIINHGKGFEYHNSKRSFRTFFKDKESPFSKINIHCDIIYGPNDKLHKFVNKTICEIIDNDKNITLYNPYLIRNFLYIDDFLSYINNLLKSLDNLGAKYTELFLSSHEFNSLHEFILTIKTLLKSNVSIKLYKGNAYKRTNEILKLEFDYRKNPKWLNLNKTLNLSSGLKKIIDRLLEARSK